MTEERLQKILAAAGYGSRRACELLIDAGKVRVNGKLAKLGDKADADKDAIMVDGKLLRGLQKKVYIAIYKPAVIFRITMRIFHVRPFWI